MTKYKVTFYTRCTDIFIVEAESEEEAHDLAIDEYNVCSLNESNVIEADGYTVKEIEQEEILLPQWATDEHTPTNWKPEDDE